MMYHPTHGLQGFADGKPSEAIQKHALGCIAVSIIFPFRSDREILNIPVKQYKAVAVKHKAARARQLIQWLNIQRADGFTLTGSVNVHSQVAAANYGMELTEELSNVHIKEHYDTFRLVFDSGEINLAEAVALQYYYFSTSFGVLRAAMRLPEKYKKLTMLMDRFSGASPKGYKPGEMLPLTNGSIFMKFAFQNAPSWLGILEENKKSGYDIAHGHLDWWSPNPSIIRAGKTHPHFILPDWLNAAAVAKHYRANFIKDIHGARKDKRVELADVLSELYDAFKTHDLWSIADDKTLSMLRGSKKSFTIPDEARDWIIQRAKG